MKNTIRYGGILFLICFISAGLLSIVYSLTEKAIIAQQKTEEAATLKKVLAGAVTIEEKKAGDLVYYVGFDAGGVAVGKALIVSGRGYGGDIVTCVGVNDTGDIIGIKVLSHTETPGLGAKIAGDSFLGKLLHRNINDIGRQDAITGATISSTALINSVQEKVRELLKSVGSSQ